MSDEMALFDLPASVLPEPPASASRTGRGRARETYARTVVADVNVKRVSVLCAAGLRAFDESPTVVVGEADPDDGAPDSREEIAREPVAALGWLLDPVVSLWPLIEADALTLTSVDLSVDEGETPRRCRLRWTVMVKLRDVSAFRQVARDACPDMDPAALAEIDASLAVAWRHAADPYAPLRGVPGIAWTPVEVSVEHIPARANRSN